MPAPTFPTPTACEMCWTLDAVPAGTAPHTFTDDLYLGDHEVGVIEAGTTMYVCADCAHRIDVRAERQHRGL